MTSFFRGVGWLFTHKQSHEAIESFKRDDFRPGRTLGQDSPNEANAEEKVLNYLRALPAEDMVTKGTEAV